MAKIKAATMFFCQECGHESSKWMGQCPGCHQWNTLVEEIVTKKSAQAGRTSFLGDVPKPMKLSEITMTEEDKYTTHMKELDRVLGGGIVPGGLVLVGGDPGIGKSTLLLQMCRQLSADQRNVLYVSGEESLKQIKMRASRLGDFSDSLRLLCETDLEAVEATIQNLKPQVVIVDSIQTMSSGQVSSAPGSVSQVRETTAVLMRLAKTLAISIFIVGHVTKEGTVAGPRVLEHMVDTVLYFEGDRHAAYRILRGVKNRFGSTDEIGVFEMCQEGLVEVENPSEYMLNGRPKQASGSAVACAIEGTRPMMIEVQALVCDSNFNLPRRQANGIDYNKVNLLMAVLEKRIGLRLGQSDAYLNLAGGLRLAEPALDLAIVMALISSFQNRVLPENMVFFGEVGLSGEVRSVSLAAQRILEARKLGFTNCVMPQANLARMRKEEAKNLAGIELIGVDNVADAISKIF